MAPTASDGTIGEPERWEPAAAVAATDAVASFRGFAQPEQTGLWSVLARASTDGGESWQAAEGVAQAAVSASLDTEPPPAPGPLELLDVSGERVRFRWAPSEADDLHRYLVLRQEPGGVLEVIDATDVEVYLDATVSAGETYRYGVIAQDTGYNTSLPTDSLEVTAEERMVDVTFIAIAPEHTTPDDTLYIAGGFQGWNPGGDPMTRVDETTWSITLPFEDATGLEYKYARGSWEAVEKDAGCGEIPNRTVTVEYSVGGTQEVVDTIEKWRDLDACP